MSEKIRQRQHAVKSSAEPMSRTPAGDALTALIMQVVRLLRLFTANGEALARPAGQTLARWLVLEAVQDGPATVAQIARSLALTRQSVQRVADLLARDGLAVYEENPGHRRAKFLQLTPQGRQVLEIIQLAQQAWANALGAEIGAADLRRASVILDRVLQVLMDQRPGGDEARR
jgi:DNA-binding MarR family transcriptional regulator